MRTERFDFPGGGGERLAARLDLPDGTPRAYALFAHCFTCGKDVNAAARLSAALAAEGIATLRFDFTGLGGSEGEFANTGFASNLADLLAAAAHLRGTGRAPALLIGHSLGGAAVLAVAAEIPEARAVATIGAPFEVAHVLRHFAARVPEVEAQGEAVVDLAGRPFRIRRSFVEEARAADLAPRIAALSRALLVMHAPQDSVVGIENARAIFEAARHPKSFVALDGADHLLSRPADAAYAARVLAAWASRYLPAPAADAPSPLPEEGLVTVEETGAGRFQQAVTIGPHHSLADEPAAVGGLGTGPAPYDLLLASLGACTAMTLRLYAAQKGLPLEHVRVALRHGKIHAADCADCETQEGKVDEISREITLEGELTEAERARLMEMADRCPVHRTLHGEIKIRTREAAPVR
ncbi:MAG TPA: bifunctional alpha/beta hydrolase/OsmC family protein [Crenalkalicoccus sp.]|nr:bifunctional alpha/beta hydrolase/OsmC family protein [Crenalkalicoccus sp.]